MFFFVENMYTCKTGILETSICVYVCNVVESMYTCKTGNFCKEVLCLCLSCYIGYVLGA